MTPALLMDFLAVFKTEETYGFHDKKSASIVTTETIRDKRSKVSSFSWTVNIFGDTCTVL